MKGNFAEKQEWKAAIEKIRKYIDNKKKKKKVLKMENF